MSDEARLIIPIPEAQKALGGLGLTKTYELIKRGQLTKVNIGRRSFVTVRSITEYVERLAHSAN